MLTCRCNVSVALVNRSPIRTTESESVTIMSTRFSKVGGLIWVCTDCYFAHHGIENDDYTPDEIPWNRWEGDPAEITSGMMRAEHDSECDPENECECEQQTFSWSQCDGCGSMLGGAREAFTYWTS